MFLGIAIVLSSLSADPAVQVYTRLEPPETPFHLPARYTISVEAPADTEVSIPELKKDAIGGLDIQAGSIETTPLPGGRRRLSHTYWLDPLDVNVYSIPPVEVALGDGEKITAPGAVFKARELTPDEESKANQFESITRPEDIAPPAAYGFWILVALCVFIACAAAVSAYLYWRRRHHKEISVVPPTPWEVAYRRLQELAQRQLAAAGKFEPYYVDLSSILRYYIEDRFELHAPEQTTPEFLETAQGSGALSQKHQELLAGFLRHCDRVKFARYEPSLEEMEQSFAVVMQFVKETEIASPAQEQQEASA